MSFPMPEAVIARPPNSCVASSAVSRHERVTYLQKGKCEDGVSLQLTNIHVLLEQANLTRQLV